jgi:4-hydroxythreonine-4-phosphate dehydrogenase
MAHVQDITIGITLGDVTGVGPEVVLKALALEPPDDRIRFVLIGDETRLQELRHVLKLDLDLRRYGTTGRGERFVVLQPESEAIPAGLAPGDPAAARAALTWLRAGAERCLRGELNGLVTAPVNKESILRTGECFVGQTEYLSALAHVDRTAMMLLGEDDHGHVLRVILGTTHLPLRKVADALTTDKVALAIELGSLACHQLGLSRARIGVCGLNPHAGEGGLLGTEELTVIAPAVAGARARRLDVSGPHAADTLFHQAYRGDYDVVVAMYHDQGLAPLKMIGFDRGVNWTVGLPFVRTSPDHGTAYDIAGRGVANPSSTRAAIRLAVQLARQTSAVRDED